MKNPVYKTVEALHDFMKARGACEDGLSFLLYCKSLDQAYSCLDAGFWQFAVEQDINLFSVTPQEVKEGFTPWAYYMMTSYHPSLLNHVPSDIRAEWGYSKWFLLTTVHPAILHHVPTEKLDKWSAYTWRNLISKQPSLYAYMPADLKRQLGDHDLEYLVRHQPSLVHQLNSLINQ